ncbi:hypothetical protein ACIO3O_19695 [Streptomyces sp. NPDC087440]|uniref:hypothetical protein n=1 Tax=Streptomyces sp. NPDC087440 TaxID=3365790 RepID=UPI0037F1878F
MSEDKRTLAGGNWRMPNREPGEDETWDRLGDDWRAVDGLVPDVRLYACWDKQEDGRSYLSGLTVSGGRITAELLRAIPVGRLENIPNAVAMESIDELAPLTRRQGEPPEQFADRVAWYYRFFSGVSSRPAKEISEHSDVPLPTVHGWIREARLRGKLPPGKRGKAG